MKNTVYYSTEEFEENYTYEGRDLGARWSPEQTVFRLWAPEADGVWLNLYREGADTPSYREEKLEKSEKGTWVVAVSGNLNGQYYTYTVVRGKNRVETADPYAVASGVNGLRSMVLDMKSLNPEGWENDENPNRYLDWGEIIICEAHIRDISVSPDSGIHFRGKFKGLTETGTRTPDGDKTGLDYLKALGITHLHLLPVVDFGSVDERKKEPGYNWGYDPLQYNIPEGSYATDAFHGEVRVREFKEMVQTLHKNGISVVLDVVYNHVYDAAAFSMNRAVPGYFSRIDENGVYSNGSGCGNDTASERSMVKRYIVDSILFWMKEYHVDGFRFDLAGLLDTEVIGAIVARSRALRPDILLYGEGWDMPTNVTKPGYRLATQSHAAELSGFAFFNDSMRDSLKGRNALDEEKGYICGAKHQMDAVRSNMMGAPFWSPEPKSVVQYVSCHDDLTLYDKICIASKTEDTRLLLKYNLLAAAVLFASSGIVFFPLGEEMLRSKRMPDGTVVSNSYNAPDEVNAIAWGRQKEKEVQTARDYYRGLIALRKEHPALREQNRGFLYKSREFKGVFGQEVIYLLIDGTRIPDEPTEKIAVIINPEEKPADITLPDSGWNVYVEGVKAGTDVIRRISGRQVQIEPMSAMYLFQET